VPDLEHRPEGVTEHGNLIIEGDNFDSLRLLKSTHSGKIRVIYIDPPYNTGNKDWVYNDHYVGAKDRWRHSQWLEFLYQRLKLARDLMTSDGVIMVSINDENRSRLELLMDEVFPGKRVGSFVWRVRSGGNDTKGAMLSCNHEHVLVYANASFEFKGEGRDEGAFSNPDNDERGDWSNDNLVQAKNAKQRPESFYPIQNPTTDIWYACDPDSVWRFSSITRPLKKKLQSDPIETIIYEGRILWPSNENTTCYKSLKELSIAIKNGTAPKQLKIYSQLKELEKLAETDVKVARLLTYIEPLENWVGRTIGYGKPRYKRFRSQLKRDVTPLSSWLNPSADGEFDDEADSEMTLTVGATAEGTNLYKKLLGNKDFPYPKPLSLLMGLLDQASKPNDIILDFFAGSGTTGHAVLELNARDNGNRRFILCSSTEATTQEPEKNICRDVCAERIRRVIHSNGYTASFAYLQMDKFEAADMSFEATPQHAAILTAMRETSTVPAQLANGIVQVVAKGNDYITVFCPKATPKAIDQLAELPSLYGVTRLAVYCPRPDSMGELLHERGIEALTYSITDALLKGQISSLKNTTSFSEVATA
jgi:adenine-specific DNA-methyltransferase